MAGSYFRFRTVDALLSQYSELEKQTIYFASPEELNDPLEGFSDLYWEGDSIVWHNLLKHYLLSLHLAYVLTKISGGDYRSSGVFSNPITSRSALPAPPIGAIYERICRRFFQTSDVPVIPGLLAESPYRIGRDVLELVLRFLHQAATNAVFSVYGEDGREPAAADLVDDGKGAQAVSLLVEMFKRIIGSPQELTQEQWQALFSVGSGMARDVTFSAALADEDARFATWGPVLMTFPEHYIDHLRTLVRFDWYAACFVVDAKNAAMWGAYGAGHQGVCLQFRSHDGDDGKPYLPLQGVVGASADRHGTRPLRGVLRLPFQPVRYVAKTEPVSFFRSIARLTVGDLERDWYTDEAGNRSSCAAGVLEGAPAWRDAYWANFQASTTSKMPDWAHEAEHRLVLGSTLGTYADPADRALRYDFADLTGITFGMRTPLSARRAIIEIVRAKGNLEGRADFVFSEAIHAPSLGGIVTRPIHGWQ